MSTLRRMVHAIFLLAATSPILSQAQNLGDPGCNRLVLVSSYFGNNVKIHDGCSGSFIRNLDSDGLLGGAQAIAIDPQGNLVVVGEAGSRLVRYHRDTLTLDRVLAGDDPRTAQQESTPVRSPTGLVITPSGRMFAGSYSDQKVVEINAENGTAVADVATQARSGIRGPDTGMILDGNRLLVPGFDSSSVVQADITQAASDQVLVTSGSGGINAPRTIVKAANGNLLITSWRSSKILEFNGESGQFIRVVSEGVARPTGMTLESAEVLLVASDRDNNIQRVRISDGQVLGTFIDSLEGPTFILVLEKAISQVESSRAFWLIGVGQVADNTIDIPEVFFTTGGSFGNSLDPDSVAEVAWGSMRIVMDSCSTGIVSWQAIESQFGDGEYAIERITSDPYGDRCLSEGFATLPDTAWMSGHWYGGRARAGEGFVINIINGNRAVVMWFTYRPQ